MPELDSTWKEREKLSVEKSYSEASGNENCAAHIELRKEDGNKADDVYHKKGFV